LDFTLTKYRQLLIALKQSGYRFQTFEQYLISPMGKVVIMRHDVDLLPQNSLATATIENELGIQGSYYFRAVPESWDEEIINAIALLGHEIGYHYEDVTTASQSKRQKGEGEREKVKGFEELLYQEAMVSFKKNLEALRQLVPVRTICMHGSPRSKYDSKDLWKHYSYKDYGIIGEPYFDVDFSKVLYITDTGRRWDGYKVSVRDKVEQTELQKRYSFSTTDDIIKEAQRHKDIEEEGVPNQIMITVHPQRWTNSPLLWTKELILQNLKNIVKRFIVRR